MRNSGHILQILRQEYHGWRWSAPAPVVRLGRARPLAAVPRPGVEHAVLLDDWYQLTCWRHHDFGWRVPTSREALREQTSANAPNDQTLTSAVGLAANDSRHGERDPRARCSLTRSFGTPSCGVLTYGFARLRCGDCAFERLVPFSRKGRGFCPSCASRRMTGSAARLVDHVLPRVPIRQWVLTLAYPLRHLLAWNHDLCRAVLGVYSLALLAFQRQRTRQRGISDGLELLESWSL
jgi:hypothetical protein